MSLYDINGNVLSSASDVNGNSIPTGYDINGNPNTFNSPYLTVMTYNVQYWGGRNGMEAVISDIFMNNKPDLVGCQECPNDGTIMPRFMRGSWGGTGTKSPLRVFYNIPCTDRSMKIYDSISGDEYRGYMKFKINVAGKDITVFNTHIEVLGTTQHYSQPAELLAAMNQEEYVIALGDFNVETHSKTGNEYPQACKPFIDAGYNLCNWTDETGFVDTWFGGSTPTGYICPCDNIITSPNIDVLDIVYDDTKLLFDNGQAIDHIPVIARLEVK